jgi:hypothetical protein
LGVRGSVVGWGTTLQAGRSRDRIPDEVNFFDLLNPSNRTMALGSTQPLTEMSTGNIPGGEGRPARKAVNLTATWEPIVYKVWKPQHLTTLWVSTARYRDTFILYLYYYWETFILSVENITSEFIRKETPQSNYIGSLVSFRVIIKWRIDKHRNNS